MIGGIVLAAGLSERMEGGPKQLLAFGDRTMVGLVVATVEATSLSPITVVLGYRAGEVETTMAPLRATITYNPRYEEGNMGSLMVGLAAVGDVDAVMLLVADQPEMDVATIETLATVWAKQRPFAAVASHNGNIGHPWVLSREAIAAVEGLSGTKALWRWLTKQHAGGLLEVEMPRDKPIDINTADDYQRAMLAMGPWEQTSGP